MHLHASIATALLLALGARAADPTFCARGAKLCRLAFSWEDCSALYIASVTAYVWPWMRVRGRG